MHQPKPRRPLTDAGIRQKCTTWIKGTSFPAHPVWGCPVDKLAEIHGDRGHQVGSDAALGGLHDLHVDSRCLELQRLGGLRISESFCR